MEKVKKNVGSLERALLELLELKYEAASSGLSLEKLEIMNKKLECMREEIERIKGIG
jgi:hypothetical protein